VSAHPFHGRTTKKCVHAFGEFKDGSDGGAVTYVDASDPIVKQYPANFRDAEPVPAAEARAYNGFGHLVHEERAQMSLYEELGIRAARIRELEARERVREELRQGDIERIFWAGVERTMQTKPGAKERYQQRLFDDALDVLDEIQSSRTNRDDDEASGRWGGGLE
jgi:hypothetical protein